jgi:SPP1 family phage portal protein
MSIYGKAYELIYADEKSKPRSVRLDPEHTFVCYSQSAFEKPLFAVYYYKKYDLDGYCTGSICRVYDESFIYTYTGLDSYTALSLQNVEPHYFFDVPIIEYRNNTEMQGDFEQLITQIDAYNVLMSDRINDKEQFVNSLLFLCNCDLDTEQAKKLLVERILMGDGDAKAEYLSKVLNEADTKVLRDDIKDDIHRLSHVPDLSDESFGNNLSGVAIKYKLLGFEQHVKNKERNFAKTLRKRLEIYNNFLVTLNAMKEVPSHRVDIGFTYNLPANELEIAQMINYLKGLASDETLLERLPFITDAKEEVEIARREQAEKSAEDMRIAENSARKVNYNEE